MRRFWMLGVLATALCFTPSALAQGATTNPLGEGTDTGATDAGATETATTDTEAAGTDTTTEPATDPAVTEPTTGTDPLGGSLVGPAPVTEKKEEAEADDGPVEPVDRTGSFGLGVEGTMGFRLAPSEFIDSSQSFRLPALSIVYPASALFHFQVLAGAVLALGSGGPASVQLGVTLRGLYLGLILSKAVSLTIPFGLGYTISVTPTFAGDSATAHYFHLEAGLRPEWFVTDYFSIHTQAGVVISLLTGSQGGSGSPVAYDPGVGLNLFANTDLMAQSGFTVWFK